MISFEFTPAKTDYIQTYQVFYLTKWKPLAAILLTGVLLGIVALALILTGGSESIYLAIFPAILCAAIFFSVIYTFFFKPYIAASQVEKNERFISPTRYDFSNDDITVKNRFIESRLDWGTFNRVIEAKKYFLLVHSATNTTFHFVPKRAFDNDLLRKM